MKTKSIYKYASEAGVPAGFYLTLMSACLLMSLKIDFLPMLLMPLAIGFPFLLGYLMWKIGKTEPAYMKLSTLWLGGIYTVIFGTLICVFFSSLYVFFLEPGFVNAYFNNAITIFEASPMASEYEQSIAIAREALELHLLPSGLEFVTTMGWFTCFAGSLLSLAIAAIITKTGNRTSRVAG